MVLPRAYQVVKMTRCPTRPIFELVVSMLFLECLVSSSRCEWRLHCVQATTPPSGGGPGSTLDFEVIRLSTLLTTLGVSRIEVPSLCAPPSSSPGCAPQLVVRTGPSPRELIREHTGATESWPAAQPSQSRWLPLSGSAAAASGASLAAFVRSPSQSLSSSSASLSEDDGACFSRSSGSLLDEPAMVFCSLVRPVAKQKYFV